MHKNSTDFEQPQYFGRFSDIAKILLKTAYIYSREYLYPENGISEFTLRMYRLNVPILKFRLRFVGGPVNDRVSFTTLLIRRFGLLDKASVFI